jgi:Domain of unknown function (DUF4388)
VALQGTIDTFEFTEVARLLATGGKTGALRLEGGRGSGTLWVADGKVVAVAVDHAPLATDPAEAMFELLRFEEGSFTFIPGDKPADPGEPADVEEILVAAEAQLAEWREIERVVPTTHATVTLRPELSKADVVLDRQRWRLVAAIGGGVTVATVGDALGLGELPVSRAVKELVELGVLELADGPAEPEPERVDESASLALDDFVLDADDPLAGLTGDNGDSSRAQLDEFAAGFGLADEQRDAPPVMGEAVLEAPLPPPVEGFSDFGMDAPAQVDPLGSSSDLGFASTPLPPDDGQFLAGGGDAAEVARQLSNLSPAAARAVAAAAKATTNEEREAALAAVSQEGDEPIDRELLLRFLASVKS